MTDYNPAPQGLGQFGLNAILPRWLVNVKHEFGNFVWIYQT